MMMMMMMVMIIIALTGFCHLDEKCAVMRWHVSKGMYKRRLQVDTNKPEDLHCCSKREIFRKFPQV